MTVQKLIAFIKAAKLHYAGSDGGSGYAARSIGYKDPSSVMYYYRSYHFTDPTGSHARNRDEKEHALAVLLLDAGYGVTYDDENAGGYDSWAVFEYELASVVEERNRQLDEEQRQRAMVTADEKTERIAKALEKRDAARDALANAGAGVSLAGESLGQAAVEYADLAEHGRCPKERQALITRLKANETANEVLRKALEALGYAETVLESAENLEVREGVLA